jgi:hypothetical protein
MLIEPKTRPDPGHDDAHHLIPAWLAVEMPALYATEEDTDPLVRCKLFTPDSRWTWFLTESSSAAPDGTPAMAFGLTCGPEDELGYMSLEELRQVRGPLGLQVERNLWWKPPPLSEVRAGKTRCGRATRP